MDLKNKLEVILPVLECLNSNTGKIEYVSFPVTILRNKYFKWKFNHDKLCSSLDEIDLFQWAWDVMIKGSRFYPFILQRGTFLININKFDRINVCINDSHCKTVYLKNVLYSSEDRYIDDYETFSFNPL